MWGTKKSQKGGQHGTPTARGGSRRRSRVSAIIGIGALLGVVTSAGPAMASIQATTSGTKVVTSAGDYTCESNDVLVEAVYVITDVVEKAGPPELINVPRTSGDVELELSDFSDGAAVYVLPIVDSKDVITGNATADIYKKWSGNFTVTLNCEPGGDPDPTPECVDLSKKVLSHDYARNNGSVTVKKGKELCKKLYVTIVRWSYVDAGSQWPQVVADKATVSLKKGTKDFSVSDGCGQFDVYYGYGQAPKLPEQLNGPNNPFEPPFLHQISSGTNPTYTVDNPKKCVTPTPTPTETTSTPTPTPTETTSTPTPTPTETTSTPTPTVTPTATSTTSPTPTKTQAVPVTTSTTKAPPGKLIVKTDDGILKASTPSPLWFVAFVACLMVAAVAFGNMFVASRRPVHTRAH